MIRNWHQEMQTVTASCLLTKWQVFSSTEAILAMSLIFPINNDIKIKCLAVTVVQHLQTSLSNGLNLSKTISAEIKCTFA